MRALVLADGAPPTRAALDAAWPGWDDPIDLVIAADGGARLASALGLPIDRWVGDGDSLGPDGLAALRAEGLAIDLAAIDKNESDAELGILAAVEAGATEVVLVGALGGSRPDHALANVALLGHPSLAGRTAMILDPAARIHLLVALAAPAADRSGEHQTGPGEPPATLSLPGRIGDLVSLIPLGDVGGAATTGLRYPLDDEPLSFGRARGLSNVRSEAQATVGIRAGRLLVVEGPATLLR
jgi:thiamine pyrophosphokinase